VVNVKSDLREINLDDVVWLRIWTNGVVPRVVISTTELDNYVIVSLCHGTHLTTIHNNRKYYSFVHSNLYIFREQTTAQRLLV
jgi:hypothetical protein